MTKDVEIFHGDMLETLDLFPDCCVDAVVTDPPYELGFMGRAWDKQGIAFSADTWREVLRVLKPGGHLLAFGGTRTFARMSVAIEDAGFEIPKSHDVSKGIDKAAGVEREVIGVNEEFLAKKQKSSKSVSDGWSRPWMDDPVAVRAKAEITAPATDAAREWQGWGTALKPAIEPITLARKPLSEPTVAANVLRWGAGVLNVDGCRVSTADGYAENRVTQGINTAQTSYAPAVVRRTFEPSAAGRWPANLIHDGSDEVVAMFPSPHGAGFVREEPGGGNFQGSTNWGNIGKNRKGMRFGDSGSAARFFYSAKASKADRAGSKHPTVKPVSLMRWLVRLITPPGGVVLDPFAGSGTTGQAALLEGCKCVLIEREAEYVRDIKHRLCSFELIG